MDAIVYTSNTGSTQAYAELLARELGLPVYELAVARRKLQAGSAIIYLGWIMAGSIKGCSKAMKRFCVKAVCGVGMAPGGTQLEQVRSRTGLPKELPVFTLQGGFYMEQLHGIYRMMMKMVSKNMLQQLRAIPNPTPDQKNTIEMLTRGKSCVDSKQLRSMLKWYQEKGETAK